jgi:hypothetical protein
MIFYKDPDLERIAMEIHSRVIILVLNQGIEVNPDVKGEIESAIIARNKEDNAIERGMDDDEMNLFVQETMIILEPILNKFRNKSHVIPIVKHKHR